MFDLFDPVSKVDGLHYACNEISDAVRATIIVVRTANTNDDFEEVTPDKTTWIPSIKKYRKETG